MIKKIVLFYQFFIFFPLYAVLPQKVIICGVCRDVADRVPHSMRIIEKIGTLFADYRVIVYENNSKDATASIIKSWSKMNKKVHTISENVPLSVLNDACINRLENGDFFRPELISRARNIVLDSALSAEYNDFDYIIWMDMDFKLEPAYEGICEVFLADREWDAVFAYGVDPDYNFWDWYAFRDAAEPFGPELLGHYWFQPKQLTLSAQGDWYPVYSSFGGCGIYKKSSIQGCRYSALVTDDLAAWAHSMVQENRSHPMIRKYLNDLSNAPLLYLDQPSCNLPDMKDPKLGIITSPVSQGIVWRMNSFVYKYPGVCEHVPFHASMIVRGHNKLFINPRLLFHYGDFIKN